LNGDTIASIIAIVAALVLAVRGLKSRPVALHQRLTMAAVWLVIIVGVVFLIHSTGIGDTR
jgi:hypothetical protein